MGNLHFWIELLADLYNRYGYWIVFLGALAENTALLGLVLPGGTLAISANLRDFGLPNGSCDHGPIPIFWFGGRYLKPTRDLSIKMRSLSMPTAQKALQAW
jgi:hypothetical protein